MDPNATLQAIVEALNNDDFDEANKLRKELANWLANGGFQPDWNKGFATYSGLLWQCTRLRSSAPF